MSPLSRRIAEAVASLAGTSAGEIFALLEHPPKPEMGDFALPCFELARRLKKPPARIATELAAGLGPIKGVREIRAVAGYLNFFADPAVLIGAIVGEVLARGEACGDSNAGEGRHVVVEFSSPNLAKPFHVGHLTTTILGASLARLFEALGYRVIRMNHLGDWGVQCGYQILAWEKWGEGKKLVEEGIDYLAELYVRIYEEARQKPEIDAEARGCFLRMEQGDERLLALWRRFREATRQSLEESYRRLNVHFDPEVGYQGEAFYELNGFSRKIIEEFRQKDAAVESEGALVVRIDRRHTGGEELPPCILLKADGATIYATRDLAAAKWRWDHFRFDRNVYVVDQRQQLHFRQVFGALKQAGCDWADRCVHVPFGVVKVREFGQVKPMSTREGTMISLKRLLDEMVRVVRRTVEEVTKPAGLTAEEKEAVCEAVGVGAVLFWIQSGGRMRTVVFDWEEATNPKGATGIYVQYAHARACGILRNYGRRLPAPEAVNWSLLAAPEELALARKLEDFGPALRRAADDYEPSYLAQYLIALGQVFSDFYHTCKVLGQEGGLSEARLLLVEAARLVLRKGLYLLGLNAPEKM